jgi:RimJ/RimL family protein N-acetyltransferase
LKIPQNLLENDWVRLEPYEPSLKSELRHALNIDADAWGVMVGTAHGDHFEAFWASAVSDMDAGTKVAFVVRRQADHEIVGTSSLYEINARHRRCEIGATFYRPDARGGVINPACKRLMLDHAFSAGVVRVEILTDAINARSRAAIEKLGARFEGVLGNHKITWTGRVRDTALYAVLDRDWPQVRDRLDARLSAFT